MSDTSFNKWLQSRLTAHGFPVGLIDGKIGKVTIAAIKAFQESKGIVQSGTAEPVTVQALREQSSTVKPGVIIPDRTPDPVKPVWPQQVNCMSFYGAVGQNQTKIQIPYDMYLAWDKNTRIRAITVHKKVAESASRVFEKVSQVYSASERKAIGLDLFGGSLNVRKMRGGSSYSMHSWGIAIDFDPERNQLSWGREKARLAKDDAVPFWEAWEAEGWLSLGRARNFDWMHIQAARL